MCVQSKFEIIKWKAFIFFIYILIDFLGKIAFACFHLKTKISCLIINKKAKKKKKRKKKYKSIEKIHKAAILSINTNFFNQSIDKARGYATRAKSKVSSTPVKGNFNRFSLLKDECLINPMSDSNSLNPNFLLESENKSFAELTTVNFSNLETHSSYIKSPSTSRKLKNQLKQQLKWHLLVTTLTPLSTAMVRARKVVTNLTLTLYCL